MLVKEPKGFTTEVQSPRIAGMNLMEKPFSVMREESKGNFLSVV